MLCMVFLLSLLAGHEKRENVALTHILPEIMICICRFLPILEASLLGLLGTILPQTIGITGFFSFLKNFPE